MLINNKKCVKSYENLCIYSLYKNQNTSQQFIYILFKSKINKGDKKYNNIMLEYMICLFTSSIKVNI